MASASQFHSSALFLQGQILFDGVQDLGFGHPLGLLLGVDLGRCEVHPAIVARIERGGQPGAGPFRERVDTVVAVEEHVDVAVDLAANHVDDQTATAHAFQDLLAVTVDAFALFVHHLVVFQQVLADLEVAFFHFLLGRFNPPRDEAAFDPFPFLHAQPLEDALHPGAGEDPHQVVFQGEEEPAAARVPLAAAATAQLQVDAPRVVPLRADHVQAAQLLDEFAVRLHAFLLLRLP